LAERDGVSRRYMRRLVNLAFLSPKLLEAILQGRQPVELTVTRLTELDLVGGIAKSWKLQTGPRRVR
jgi:site-specific DNA recombinase